MKKSRNSNIQQNFGQKNKLNPVNSIVVYKRSKLYFNSFYLQDQRKNSLVCFNDNNLAVYESQQYKNYKVKDISKEDLKKKLRQQQKQLIEILTDQSLVKNNPIIIKKNNNKSRKSAIKLQQFQYFSSSNNYKNVLNQQNQFLKSNLNPLSIKNIEGKILKKSLQQQLNSINQPKKSCLKSSKLYLTADQKFISTDKSRISFFGLKNIQGKYINKENRQPQENEKKNTKSDSQISDDQVNEHNVFTQTNEEEILKVLQNMNKMSGGNRDSTTPKKSILKKTSVLQSQFASSNIQASQWKKNIKKSVCFKK